MYISIKYFLYLRSVSSKSSNIFYFKSMKYLLNRGHEFLLAFYIFFHLNFLRKSLAQILIIFLSDLLFDYFLDGIKVVILENVILKIFKLLVTEGTTMVTVYGLLNAGPTIHMAASGDVTVTDGVETNCTLKLCL